ncbi:hypothetical protein Q1695_012168 [Nippostrongylus brasiliensis]|nr:hypothetical protein Q1695_012168 [Nippostrongylus brasiliensis]
MNPPARKRILARHNELRGSISKGLTEKNGKYGIAPPTGMMNQLQYNCDAESYAQQHANTCDGKEQPASGHYGYKENIYIDRNTAATKEESADRAMDSWWGELSSKGIRTDMLFTKAAYKTGIQHFTKMAWDNNVYIGCAVAHCNSFNFVVCMYSPGGNTIGERVYKVGAVCSGCPNSCTGGLCFA